MAGSAASAGFKGLDKLEAYAKKPVERWDIAADNKKQLRDLLRMYNNSLDEIGELQKIPLHDLDGEDRIIKSRLAEYEIMLHRRLEELHSLEESVEMEGAKIIKSRVKRNREIMDQCEVLVAKYRDYYEASVRPSRERNADFETARGRTEKTMGDGTVDANISEPDSYVGARNVPLNPPRLILDYNTVTTYEGKLNAGILNSLHRSSRIVGALGIGGVGKTCALRGLADDKDIKDNFPDGILFIQLGNDSHLSDVIQGIAKTVERTGGRRLSRRIRRLETVEDAAEEAGQWFGRRKCLFLVDDIWEVNGITPHELRKLGTMLNDESLLVYTTRARSFSEGADKKLLFDAREVHGELARCMLLNHADMGSYSELSAANRDAVSGILGICQGLPLALGIAGATASSYCDDGDNSQDAWSEYYHDLGSNEESIVGGKTSMYGPLVDIVERSLKVLDTKSRLEKKFEKMFQGLCVLRKQQSVGGQVLQKLWNLSDLRSTREIAASFGRVSLLRIERKRGNKFFVRAHDLVLDIANDMALENDKRKWFKTLLKNYIPKEPSTSDNGAEMNTPKEKDVLFTPWWSVEDDGFIHDNVCRLLQGAEAREGLIWLLLRARWIVIRLQRSGITGVEGDLELGQEMAAKGTTDQKGLLRYFNVIRSAARMSFLKVAENPYDAWFQMYGRVAWYGKKCELAQAFIYEISDHAPRPWVEASVGFLEEATGAALETIQVGVDPLILSMSHSGDVLKILFTDVSDEAYVFEYYKASGREKMQWLDWNRRHEDSGYRPGTSDGELRVPTPWTLCGAFSDNLKWLVTGHEGGSLVVWNIDSGYKFEKHMRLPEPAVCVAISGDGRIIASAPQRGGVFVWDTSSGAPIENRLDLLTEVTGVNCLAVSFDGRIIVGSGYHRIQEEMEKEGSSGHVRKGNSVSDGLTSSGVRRRVCHIWNREIGEVRVLRPKTQDDDVVCVSTSRDGSIVVSGSQSGAIRVWTLSSPIRPTVTMKGQSDVVNYVALSSDGKRLVSVSGSYWTTIHIWSAETGEQIGKPSKWYVGYKAPVGLSSNGKEIATVLSSGNEVRMWNVEHRDASDRMGRSASERDVACIAYCGQGKRIVTTSEDGLLRVWDRESGRRIDEAVEGETEKMECVAVSADGNRFVSGSKGGIVRVWNMNSGKAVGEALSRVEGEEIGCSHLAVNADATRVALARRGVVYVWNVESGAASIVTREASKFTNVDISLDGTRIVFVLPDYSLTVWDVERRQPVGSPLQGHIRGIDFTWKAALSGDGRRVVFESTRDRVGVWDVSTGTIGDSLVHDRRVVHVETNADGSQVVSYDDQGCGRLWDVACGRYMTTSSAPEWTSTLRSLGLARINWQESASRQHVASIMEHTDAVNEQLLASTDRPVLRIGDVYFLESHGSTFWPFCRVVR